MSTPEPGQDVEVTIRGRVTKARPGLILITRTDGNAQWIDLPQNLMDAVEWRPLP